MFVLSVKNGDDKRKILDIFLNKILLELADQFWFQFIQIKMAMLKYLNLNTLTKKYYQEL